MPTRRLLDRIDLHVAWLLVLIAPASAVFLPFPWAALPVVLLPQGIVLTRFDALRSVHVVDARRYLFINQILLLLSGAVTAALNAAVRSGA